MIQLTIIKIQDYGPWTLTLGSDREHRLQMLQASIYKELQRLFSEKNGIVFLNRSDEFFAVTNSISLEDHIKIQKELKELFDLKLTMSIGIADNPFDANFKAYESKKYNRYLDKNYDIFGVIDGKEEQKITIIHLDVDNITSTGNTKSPYEISSTIFNLYSKMSEFFLIQNSMTFFMGGDNFMIVTTDKGKESVKEFLKQVKKENDITLNCGIGSAHNAREAIRLATKSLDTIREIRDSGDKAPEIYELSCS